MKNRCLAFRTLSRSSGIRCEYVACTVASLSPMNSATARTLRSADRQTETNVCRGTCIMWYLSSGRPARRRAPFQRSLTIVRCSPPPSHRHATTSTPATGHDGATATRNASDAATTSDND